MSLYVITAELLTNQSAIKLEAAGLPWLPASIGFYLDGLSLVMWCLIAFLGWVIVDFSIRSLDGDPSQPRFLKWMNFTLGSVTCLVLSSNLLMFWLAWVLSSLGLHQLLTHYQERSRGQVAAKKKFIISRLGDAFLIAACAMTYYQFGTLEYDQLFIAATELIRNPQSSPAIAGWIGTFFVLGAMTKSAQFPLHSWLPETMESPTAVSALMHAGIINAGGFLVLRLSPLVELSPIAMDALALIGAVTAIFGAIVMLTQTSVKVSLAYSTIAQMGFMMLQCGLGAFTAALLHIVAHSLYKAHAFLTSGSVIDELEATRTPALVSAPIKRQGVLIGLALCVAAAVMLVMGAIFDLAPGPGHGSLALGAIMAIALAQLLSASFVSGNSRVVLKGLVMTCLVALGYFVLYSAVDRVFQSTVAHTERTIAWYDATLISFIVIAFASLYFLQWVWPYAMARRWGQALYVHAYNGFYVDLLMRRLITRRPASTTA